MKVIISILICFVFSFTVKGQEFTTKDFSKNYIQMDSKNPFGKSDKICFIGANVTLKTMEYQRKGSLNKMSGDHIDRFASIIDGISYDDVQELADYFKSTLELHFSKIGYTIVDPSTVENQDEYKKLLAKETSVNTGEFFSQMAAGQEWGAAITFAAGKKPIFKYPKMAMGAHTKLASKNDAIMVNLSVLLEPFLVNWDKKFVSKFYDSEEYKHTFSFDPIAQVSHFSNLFTYDLPMNIVSPNWGALSFDPMAYIGKSKIKYQSSNDYVKAIKKGSPSGDMIYKEQQGLMLYTVTVDRDLFIEAMKKTLDAYAFNLAEYAKSKK